MRQLTLFLLGCWIIVSAGVAYADANVQPPSVTFDRAIHFMAGEGHDIQLPPGIYGVEQAGQERLRLVPDDSRPPIEIQASSLAHDESFSTPLSMAVIEEGQGDQVHVVLLFPNGEGLDAIGSFSGTRSRAAVRALGRVQVQTIVAQSKVTSQMSSLYLTVPVPSSPVKAPSPAAPSPILKAPSAPAAVTAPPSTETVDTSGPGNWVTWNYLAMHHPEMMAQFLADVQSGKQSRTSIAGLASEVELNDMFKTNWTAEVNRFNTLRDAGMTPAGVTPRGLPDGLSLKDQVSVIPSAKSPLSATAKVIAHDPFTVTLPPRNLGSVWAGGQAMTVVSITAPADGYVEGRFNLNATNRHFRIVNAKAYTGVLARGKAMDVSQTIPGGQYQDVVPDPATPPAQISKAGFVAILAKKGQRIDFTVAFEPVALGMTPVGDNEATLQVSGATSSEINILSPNAPMTTWTRIASIRARFEGINFGVIGTLDDTAITVFYDGTPCGRVIPVPAGITFHNAEQQARSISVTGESLAPALHVQPFTVSLGPGERKHVPIPLQIDSCPDQGIEQTGTIKFAYPGVVRHAEFSATLYPNFHHWFNGNSHGSVGSCDYTWDIYIHSSGARSFAYSLRNRNFISQMQIDFAFSILGQKIGGGVLMDGPNTVHTKTNAYTQPPSSFVRDNYVRWLSAPAQVRMRCHTPGF